MNLDINSSNKLVKEILDRNLNYEKVVEYYSQHIYCEVVRCDNTGTGLRRER